MYPCLNGETYLNIANHWQWAIVTRVIFRSQRAFLTFYTMHWSPMAYPDQHGETYLDVNKQRHTLKALISSLRGSISLLLGLVWSSLVFMAWTQSSVSWALSVSSLHLSATWRSSRQSTRCLRRSVYRWLTSSSSRCTGVSSMWIVTIDNGY